MARNRIIYASQSVWINGEVLYRVQSLGTTTSFTSEDVFELGQLDIIDVVDDVPAVAVTLNTNDFGDVKTLAVLSQVAPAKLDMAYTATPTNANLVSGSTYLHGVALADFAVTCGNLTGVTLWAPVQDECSIGTLANNIDQTLFLDRVYVNSFELSYTTGANATENYGAETDNKRWFLNAGRFINFDEFDLTAQDIVDGYVDLTLDPSASIAEISTGIGFLRTDDQGAPAISHYDDSENTMTNVEIIVGDTTASGVYVYENTGTDHRVWFPTDTNVPAEGDRLQVIYSADAYAGSMNTYFTPLEDPTTRPSDVGALRQGQIEVYIVDPDAGAGEYANAWRLTGATISADLTREPLAELGHLSPYDRPLTLPIPITVTVDSTAGDLENWARFAGKHDNYLSESDTSGNTSFDDIAIKDLMTKGNLVLVVKVFEQTDEEAGGTGDNRKVLGGSSLIGKDYFNDGVKGTYSVNDREYALKTVIVKNLKITDEGMTLDLGSNATQTFGFRANNDLFVIKGNVSYSIAESTILRNA
jgi:hypothetical protein